MSGEAGNRRSSHRREHPGHSTPPSLSLVRQEILRRPDLLRRPQRTDTV